MPSSPTPILRVALVGCGKVARYHAAAVRSLPGLELVAVCARRAESAEAFGREFGAQPFTDAEKMAREAAVDIAIVTTQHPQHADPSVAALRGGAHVLIEKPLASSLADCDRILNQARASGRRVGTISQRRFYPPCQRVRRAIDEGKIGRPVLGTAVLLGWRDADYYRCDPWRGSWQYEGGGVLVNQAPHMLDLLLWYFGEIEEVSGYWANVNHPTIEVEDTAVAIVRFRSGALGNLVLSNSQNPALHGRVVVHGSNGASVGVQTDGGAMFVAGRSNILEAPYNHVWLVPGEEKNLDEWRREDEASFHAVEPISFYFARQIEDFASAIRQNREPAITGDDGRRTVELFTAIYRSMRDRRSIKFPLADETGRTDFDGRLAAS
jgi:predicted dehydrogenase